MAGAVAMMMHKVAGARRAANEGLNAPVDARESRNERSEEPDVDIYRARTPSNNNTPRVAPDTLKPALAPETLGAKTEYVVDTMCVKAHSYTTASYTSGGTSTSNASHHSSGPPVLWRAVFDRYRFGKLNLLTPAPLMYIQLVLRRRCAERAFIKSLFSHSLFVVLIVSMIFTQRSVANVYQMETSISDFFGGLSTRRADSSSISLDGISSVDDVWTWTRGALIPVTLTEPETLDDGRIVIRMYNQLVGSVRITQRAVYDGSCVGSPTLLNQSTHCYSSLTRSKMDSTPFGPWHDPTRYEATRSAINGWDEYTVDLGTEAGFAVERILDMIDTAFIGPGARHLSIDMLFYNNALDLFCYARIVFVINPSGAIDVQEFYETVPVDTYATNADLARLGVELLLALMTLYRIFVEVREVFNHWKDPELRVVSYFMSVGNVVDWAYPSGGSNVACGPCDLVRSSGSPVPGSRRTLSRALACVVVGFALWIEIQLNSIKGSNLRGNNEEAVMVTDKLIQLSAMWKQYTVVNCTNLLLALFTFFKVFTGHDKLSIVTATLSRAASELIYFMVVYGVVTILYMLIGTLLFGSSLEDFSTLNLAFDTLFLMQIGGYEYANLAAAFDGAEDAVPVAVSYIYYYSFMALVFLILFNILLGILIDAFVNVQEDAKTEKQASIQVNSGGAYQNVNDMGREWFNDAQLTLRYGLSFTGLVARPNAAHRLWSEEKWLSVVNEVVYKKKMRKGILRSGTMVSLLAAMRKLPSCKGADIFYQAKHRFMSDEITAGGFGDVWPRTFDEADAASSKMTHHNQADLIKRDIRRLEEKIEASINESQELHRSVMTKLDFVLAHLVAPKPVPLPPGSSGIWPLSV